MVDKILLTFLVLEAVFVLTGALVLVGGILSQNPAGNPLTSDVAVNLLLQQTPLTGAIANGVFVFLTFIVSIPGMFLSKNCSWLRAHSWLVMICAMITMVLGLDIWISTLRTRSNLESLWALQTPHMQESLQQEFQCCGYLNSTSPMFQVNKICPSAAAASLQPGCIGPFSSFANGLLDVVFTSIFGICALDMLVFLSASVVIKSRREKERYRLIDEKSGHGGI